MNRMTLADGRSFAWRETGSGAPVVLLHGWSMSSAVFTEVLEELGDSCRVLAPDLRGHGASDPGDGYGYQDFAADVTEWRHRLGLEGVALCGWSLGGGVALELASRGEGWIASLLLQSTTPRFAAAPGWPHGLPQGQVRAMGRNLARDYERTMSEFFALQFQGEEIDRERYRQIVSFAVRQGRLPAPEVALASLETLRTGDQSSLLGEIACRTLVVHGDLDQITPVGAGRALAAGIPRAELRVLEGAGHAPFLSRPEECLAAWKEFLA